MSPRTRSLPAPQTLRSGPWKGVYDTPDPFDAGPDRLRNLLNGLIPDAEAGSDAYARNGFAVGNAGVMVAAGAARALFTVTLLDGSRQNYAIIAGRLYRFDQAFESAQTFTDVTPVGITITNTVFPVYVTPMVSNEGGTTQVVIIINDHYNTPWVGSNLTATPITGTPINYDGLGSAWLAWGKPAVWQGSVFFVLNSVNGVSRREDIAWSEPGLPLTGYQQATSDNNMTLIQNTSGPLFCLAATNLALYYFRAESIGVVYGDIGSLKSTNTQDLVDAAVGCIAAGSIQQFGGYFYFLDAFGRPYRFTPGSAPEPLWKQMRGVVNDWGQPGDLGTYASSAIEPGHGLYVTTIRRPDWRAAAGFAATVMYVFNARTGIYQGQWTVYDKNDGLGGVGVMQLGTITKSSTSDNAQTCLALLGELQTPNTGTNTGFLWFFRQTGWPDGAIGTDDDQWLDGNSTDLLNLIQPNVQVTTDRLGEDTDVVYNVDRASLLTRNGAACKVTVVTPNTAGTVEGTPTPAPSDDTTYRLVCGFDGVQGRGPSVIVAPVFDKTTAATLDQWGVSRVTLTAVPSQAGPEEP